MPDYRGGTPERDPTTGIPMPAAFSAGGVDPLEYISGDLAGGYDANSLPSWFTQKYSPGEIEGAIKARVAEFAGASNQNTADAMNQLAGVKAGAPPTFQEDGSPYTWRAFPDIFKKGAPPTGWFTLQDYYGQLRQPDAMGSAPDQSQRTRQPDASSGLGAVPGQFQSGSGGLSTNDWRLLPAPWRTPDNFMINGHIISRGLFNTKVKGLNFSNMGAELGSNPKGYWPGNYGAPWISASGTTNAGLGGTLLNDPFFLGQIDRQTY